jgi:hypothetical protein
MSRLAMIFRRETIGAAIALRDLHVFEAVAVDPEADQRFALVSVRLDVNIGRILAVGVGDDLVGETDDGAVVLVEIPRPAEESSAASAWASVTSSPRMSETFSSSLRPPASPPSGRGTEELGDVSAEADGETGC